MSMNSSSSSNSSITSLAIISAQPPVQPIQVYQIYHARENAPNFNRPLPAYWTNKTIRAEVFQKVGEARTNRLEEAYYLTQNVEYAWGGANDPNSIMGNVSRFRAWVCRSTFVGDVIVCGNGNGNNAFMVNTMGWIDVSDPVIAAV
jgi:hypothetical protein